ncbi:MAG: carbamoyl-phosphate synthase large subunit [Eubacteriales bacterium]|nr:carbamoyl-phosphate synthase large subunit [Eubacteriales bacterium]
MPRNNAIKKVLVIGSGPIVIGQAAEFDYAGTQACRVLKNEGIKVVLVNSNPATIMTDRKFADFIYLEPLNGETVKRIIQKEKPDSLLAGFGGQTGLTIAMQLTKEGFLEKNGVRLIGTNAGAIAKAEDRQLFKDTMNSIGQPTIPSATVYTSEEASLAAESIGYPVIVRPAYTLGGAGGGVAYDKSQLMAITGNGLQMSPIHQVLIEKYIYGWKEIEFEVIRDSRGNAVTVCSMENIDPVGIHTGDSIVVAPALTLSDKEYQMLRSASLKIISELGIEGGCNCQFALDPDSFDYAVIEVNPRVSRSSALASKASGYPIAKVAAKIALGYTLDEIKNDITGKTCACFEPAMDYVVLKMPKWPFDKFVSANRKLGTQMKATGETMAIATNLESAFLKSLRGSEISLDTPNHPYFKGIADFDIIKSIENSEDLRVFALFEAIKRGISVDIMHEITKIDRFFLYKLKNIADYENEISSFVLTQEMYERGKKLGYTDRAIFEISGQGIKNPSLNGEGIKDPSLTLSGSGGEGMNPSSTSSVSCKVGINPSLTVSGSGEEGTSPSSISSVSCKVGMNPSLTSLGSGQEGMNPSSISSVSCNVGMNPSLTSSGSGEEGTISSSTSSVSCKEGMNPSLTLSGSGDRVTNPSLTSSGSGGEGMNPSLASLGSGEEGTNLTSTSSVSCNVGMNPSSDLSGSGEEVTNTSSTSLVSCKVGMNPSLVSSVSGEGKIHRLFPSYKMVDTCAAEFMAETPYFYSCYDSYCEAASTVNLQKDRIIVLGSGPIRIGQGIEFDYSCVHCAETLRELRYEVIIINNNPETVSTDFDISDRLYFEPLTEEDVLGVIRTEKPVGVVVAFGGQTAIKLAKPLEKAGIRIFGTSAEGIDIAEDRERFDDLLSRFGIKRPVGHSVLTTEEAVDAAEDIGYPVLLRPSYVIGGQNMTIAYTREDVVRYMHIILLQGITNPVLVDKYMSGTELEVDVISDGEEVLIPGIMEHIERAGVHSGDSIAIYPPVSINDKMLTHITDCSIKLAKALGTKGLVNIQYLISHNELYVIEVNPRASRTVPYISKVTGVPMVEIATKVMVGHMLSELGYTGGLYKIPPYMAVKVPVFSFEKLSDVNSALGPEMKSTGEVLGIGRTLNEALFKGLVSAGFDLDFSAREERKGVILSVSDKDKFEIVGLAKKLDDLGMRIYATKGTASAISSLGIDVTVLNKFGEDNSIIKTLESGSIRFVVITGRGERDSVRDYIEIHRKCILQSVACLTSLDTANALADIIASRFNIRNTELVDINNLRTEKSHLNFVKMQGTGNDYIYFENFGGEITCPESLSITVCDRNYGIGGDGIVLIEKSDAADAKMRIFNKDGSEGKMAGNSIRCVGKYLYDNKHVDKENLTIETASGIKKLKLYIFGGQVRFVSVDMGKAELDPKKIPVMLEGESVIDREADIEGKTYRITCVSVGNPHCVVFCDRVDAVVLPKVGPQFEKNPLFPERINTEFVRVVNKSTLKMRVWERGNGETFACGTGACAAVVAAVENGYCKKNEDITVKLKGGDLIVNYSDEAVTLTGNADFICEGRTVY